LDESTFKELSERADQVRPYDEGLDTKPRAAAKETPESSEDSTAGKGKATKKGRTRRKKRPLASPNRKGRNGEPYVRKSDGVATVPQYLTLPANLVKQLKIYAVENDAKVSEVAAEAIAAYLESH